MSQGTNLPGESPGIAQGVSGTFDFTLVAALMLESLALAQFFLGRYSPVLPLAGGVILLLVLLLRHVQHRRMIERKQFRQWHILLLLICLLQGGIWTAHLIRLEGATDQDIASGALAVVLAFMPLLYWIPGLLLALGLAMPLLLSLASGQVRWWLGLTLVLLLLWAWVMRRFSREHQQYHRAHLEYQQKLDDWNLRYRDLEERLLYESECLKSCRQELDKVQALANQAARIKTEFLATISHEIRTPLNGILPILEMLQGTHLNEEQKRFVRAASSSSRHLLRIINDILDFARAESGKLQLESIEIDLRELGQSTLDLMAGSAERKGLELKMHIASETTTAVRGDPVRLRQILTNLLGNAIKFTDQGSVELFIEQTGSSGREVELRFSVTDTGIGLSPAAVRGLFSSFTQADASTTRRYGGTGLGLAICRQLVELMGGRIGVHSALGQGSSFWFVLPMRRSRRDLPSVRTSLDGVRLVTSIMDEQLATQVSDSLAQWHVKEDRAPPSELLWRLRDKAIFSREPAYECLIVDGWGKDQNLLRTIREIRGDFLLKSLHIILVGGAAESDNPMYSDLSIHVLNGSHRPELLHRLLVRLFDVDNGSDGAVDPDELLRFQDLNLEQESLLLAGTGGSDSGKNGAGRPRVLLVEDNPVNLGVVQQVLKRLGAACVIARNGQEALDILMRNDQVDIVLMDCQMPVMDGYEATRAWRAKEQDSGRHIPIIAMTANAMPGDNEKCRAAGMDDYLAKPVGIDELAELLLKWGDADTMKASQSPGRTPEKQADNRDMPILDVSILGELREILEDGFASIVNSYLEHSPGLMGELQQAAEAGDLKAIVASAHSLKSSSANLGAIKLSALASTVEMAAREGNAESALHTYREMPAVYLATSAALREELQR